MIGISVYLSDIDESYILKASEYGARYIFTSLHIPEEQIDDLDQKLPRFLELVHSLGMSLIPDISPYTFEKLGLQNNDFGGLKNLGFDLVRLDFGFEDVDNVIEISKHFNIVLNASLVDGTYLRNLQAHDFDLSTMYLMHNFYPRQDTGLSEPYFRSLNDIHKEFPIKTMVFVPGDKKRRLPLYEGLPTLEKHRDVNPYVAAVELISTYGIDSIFIGDNQAHHHTLKFINDYEKDRIVTIPARLNEDYAYLYEKDYAVRKDQAEAIIRLAIDRVKDLDIESNNMRKRGSIIVDNKLAGRYSGEIQILKKTMIYSSRSNNIGWVHPEYVDVLDAIDHHTKIRFVRIEEVL